MDAGPLEGTHVLDFSIIYAGPYAGMHLADLGAEVTKVEQPGGDPFRHTAAVIPGNSKVFQYLNRGKRSIVIDLRNERGREVAHRLVSDADVVKISVIGVGMRSHAGIAQRMFQALAEKGINIQVISTSEIKVSVLVAEEYTELALRALHTAYGLDDE